ncbi:MAG TPA: kelch repeat-containing protein [Candidatus Eremiobacteraceae bacterium]
MLQRLSIVGALLACPCLSTVSGCSGGPHSSLLLHSGLTNIVGVPQAAGSWTTKAPMLTAREGLAVGVLNGILYAVGGFSSDGPLNTVEAYNPATDTWTTKTPLPSTRWQLAASVIGDRLYVVGGCCDYNFNALNTVDAYNPVTDKWTRKAFMPTARRVLAAGTLRGRLYAVGGFSDGNILDAAEAFNPQ